MKKITVLFTVLLMLAASSVFAAPVLTNFGSELEAGSAGLYDTHKTITGFYTNQTNDIGSGAQIYTGSIMGIGSFHVDSTKFSDVSGVPAGSNPAVAFVEFFNSTNADQKDGGLFGAPAATDFVAEDDLFGFYAESKTPALVGSDETTITGLVSIRYNATSGNQTFFVPTGGKDFMVGFANTTLDNSTTTLDGSLAGTSLQFIYNKGVFDDSFYNDHDTWSYYAFGGTEDAPGYRVAQVKFNKNAESDPIAQVKLDDGDKWVDYAVEVTDSSSSPTTTTGISIKAPATSTNPDHYVLFDRAAINADGNIITGRVSGIASAKSYFAVMIKNGSNLSKDDLANRAFKFVYAGAVTYATGGTVNATGGLFSFNINQDLVLAGVQQEVNATGGSSAAADSAAFIGTDLVNLNVNIEDTDHFGPGSQSNMTVYDAEIEHPEGSFFGKMAEDKSFAVGIYLPAAKAGETSVKALGFLVPTPVVEGQVVRAPLQYKHESLASPAMMSDGYKNKAYSATTLRKDWKGFPSEGLPLTVAKSFNATYSTTTDYTGDYYATFRFGIKGIADKVDNLRLCKLIEKGDSKTVREYHYADSDSKNVLGDEGAWWLTQTDDSDIPGSYVGRETVLNPERVYYVNFVIKDNGDFDTDHTNTNTIVDPVMLVHDHDSSSSSGCVFNPAAGFGLEWLLLMLAPMVAVVRSRFKK